MSTKTSPALRTVAIGSALALAYSSSAIGFNALISSASISLVGALGKQGGQRIPMFSESPRPVFKGANPGRDPERGRLWSTERRAALDNVETARALRQLIERGEGDTATGEFLFSAYFTVATATLSGGEGMPGEGSTSAGPSGSVNTNTGNKATYVDLAGWTTRGGMEVPFRLAHNSTGSFNGTVGKAWSHSYDAEIAATPGPTGPAIVRMPDGLSIPFTQNAGVYTAPPGRYEILTAVAGGGWKLSFKDRTVWNFNAGGFLASIVDRSGNVLTLTRNAGGFLTKVTDPVGRELQFTYNAANRIDTVKDPMNRVWTLGYNPNGNLTSILYPDPQNGSTPPTRTFGYDGADRITSETDLRGKVWGTTYDASGRLWKETNPLNKTTTYTYAAGSTRIDLPLAYGTGQVHNYSSGVLASVVDESGFSEAYTARDAYQNVTSKTDKSGKIWGATYDTRGNLLTRTNPLSKTWTYTYTATNELLTVKSPLNHTVTYGHDAAGRRTTTKVPVPGDPNRIASTLLYNSYGQPITMTDGEGRVVTYSYDSMTGNLSQVTDAANVITTFGHDLDGARTSSTDAASKQTLYGRDGWGRETGITSPGGAYTLIKFDGNGNATSSRDELGRTSVFEYDDANRLTGIVNPKGERQDRGYNDNGWLGFTADGNLHYRQYAYNPRGEVFNILLADGTSDFFSKNGRGETTGNQRPDGTTVLYGFDDAGNPTLRNYPGSTPDESYGYDASDRRTSMVDATGTTTWTIDEASRITMIAQPYGSISYVYNKADQRTKLTEVGQGDINYVYGPTNGRLLTVTNRLSETTSYGYDTLGRFSSTTFANGNVETYGYDGRDRKNAITLKNSASTTLRTEAYVYDDASQIGTHTVNGVATTYTYDPASQLIGEVRTGYTGAYTYDANGNRLTKTLNGTTETFAYDVGDKLLNVKVGGTTIRSYGYNAAGSATSVTTSSGTTNVTWDEDERTKTVNGPGIAATYGFNGEGARLSATENGTTRLEKRDGTGVTAPLLNDNQANYTPGISEYRGGASTFQHAGTKNVAAQTNAAGAVSSTRQYDAFGSVLASTGTFKGPFGYGGAHGYREDASGLRLLGHRMYDSSAGRFLSRDPARDGRNWYSYCGNDPVNGTDPTGLKPGDKFYDDPGKPGSGRNKAGIAAVDDVRKRSDDNHVEYGGYIYQNPDGSYSYGAPYTSNLPEKVYHPPFKGEPGQVPVGNYHTHPSDASNINNAFFSDVDKDFAKTKGPLYMIDGNTGQVKVWIHDKFGGDGYIIRPPTKKKGANDR